MKLISSGEIRSRIIKAIKGEEFCGGEKCLFYQECVADKRDTDCEEFITELLEKGFRRADERKKITIERNICPKPECGDEFPIPKEGWKGASDEHTD